MRVLNHVELYTEAEPVLRSIFDPSKFDTKPFSDRIQDRKIIYEYHYRIESPLIEAIILSAKQFGDGELYVSTLYPPIVKRELLNDIILKVREHNFEPTDENLKSLENSELQEVLRPLLIAAQAREFNYPLHWKMSIEEFEESYIPRPDNSYTYPLSGIDYLAFAYFGAQAVYSSEGSWAFMIGDESFGFLGGTRQFMEGVSYKFPDVDQQVYQFVEIFKIHKAESPWRDFSWVSNLIHHVYGNQKAQALLKDTNFL